jgi:hypothetical protein
LQCVPVSGLGFRRGSYMCLCKRGFYFPDTTSLNRYFNGTVVEEEYEKYMLVSTALPYINISELQFNFRVVLFERKHDNLAELTKKMKI